MTEAADDKMLCYCRNVRYGRVRECIAETHARSVEQVMAGCNAGTGCRSCHPEIEQLLEEAGRQRRSGLGGVLKRLFGRDGASS